MRARSAPYPSPGYSVRIGAIIWTKALETMGAYATLGAGRRRRGSEALVYLAGVVSGQEMIVTGLYRLHHEPQGDRVAVTPEEARWLLQLLRTRDEKLIAQMHSHRGLAGHSHGDDVWATSFHEGFLSIVVPHFGAGVSAPSDCAVLEYRNGQFVELERNEVASRIHIYAETVERHALPAVRLAESDEESGWRAFAGKLKSIALKRR